MLRDRSLAEDVVQQVALEALRDSSRFQARSSKKTWLCSIAFHRCQDLLKTNRRRVRRFVSEQEVDEDPLAPQEAHPTTLLEHARLCAAMNDCIARLPHKSQLAVLLRFHGGMSYEEMAAELNEKPDTLQARVSRALVAIRRELEARGWSAELALGL